MKNRDMTAFTARRAPVYVYFPLQSVKSCVTLSVVLSVPR